MPARILFLGKGFSGRSLPKMRGAPRAQCATSCLSTLLSGSKSPSQRPCGRFAGCFGFVGRFGIAGLFRGAGALAAIYTPSTSAIV